MYRIFFITLLFVSFTAAAEELNCVYSSLYSVEQVKNFKFGTLESAKEAALQATHYGESASYLAYVDVVKLTRAHKKIEEIEKGDWVWLVLIQNAAASDIYPIPDQLVWIGAKEGNVVNL